MTTRNRFRAIEGSVPERHRRRIGAARAAAILAATAGTAVVALLLGSLVPARAGAAAAPLAAPGPAVVAPPDSTAALRVETMPPGLIVFVDGDPVGRSPLTVAGLRADRVRVRVLRDDPRRVDRARDEADVRLAFGDTTAAFFDLRPPVTVETEPLGADVTVRRPEIAGDSLLGDTPLAVPRSLIPDRFFLFHHSCCADTVLAGSALLALAAEEGTARVALRPALLLPAAASSGRPIYRRRWVQWGLVLVGAGLTGTSALLKREGDRWYDRYLDSSDRTVLEGYFDRAVRYDRLSLVALGVGQALFTGGLVLLVSHSSR